MLMGKKYTKNRKITTKTALSKSDLRAARKREQEEMNKATSTKRTPVVTKIEVDDIVAQEEVKISINPPVNEPDNDPKKIISMYFDEKASIEVISDVLNIDENDVLETILCKEYETKSMFEIQNNYHISRLRLKDILIKHGIEIRNAGNPNFGKKKVETQQIEEQNTKTKEKNVLSFNFADQEFSYDKLRSIDPVSNDNHVCVAGLVNNRHEIKGIDKFIFEEVTNEELNDPSKLEGTVLSFLSDNFKDDKDNTLILYCTGLQLVLSTVISVCAQLKINVITMHWNPDTKGYIPQETLCIFGKYPDIKKISTARNLRNIQDNYNRIYLYDCDVLDIMETKNVIHIDCNFGSKIEDNIDSTIIIFNKEFPDAEVWSIFGDLIKSMQREDLSNKKHNVMIGKLTVTIGGYQFGDNIAKSYNYTNPSTNNNMFNPLRTQVRPSRDFHTH